jgi:hypothetical protein
MFLGKSCAVGSAEADFSVTRFLCDSVSPWLILSVGNFRKLTTETQRHRGESFGELFGVARS